MRAGTPRPSGGVACPPGLPRLGDCLEDARPLPPCRLAGSGAMWLRCARQLAGSTWDAAAASAHSCGAAVWPGRPSSRVMSWTRHRDGSTNPRLGRAVPAGQSAELPA